MSRNPFEFRQQPVLDSSRKEKIQLTLGVFAAVGIAASKALVIEYIEGVSC